jgi:N-acetylneuraminic acid mutarotase
MTDLRERLREVDSVPMPELWPEAQRRASEPGGSASWPEGPRGGRLVAGLVAFALFVTGSVLAARVFLGDEPTTTPGTGPWAGIGPGWTQLPPPPFERARSDSTVAWTGSELFVWGGGTDNGETVFSNGALYDPSSDRWREIADSPLNGRTEAEAVWTGSEVLVFGEAFNSFALLRDGAAYDPASDTWRRIPDIPRVVDVITAHVWTGSELIILGWRTDNEVEHTGVGAAYDPARDSWRQIASAPLALNRASGVWTGSEAIFYGSYLDHRNRSATRWAQGIAYNPSTDRWRVPPEHEVSPQASWANWTGNEMLVWDYETNSALYDSATDSWREPNPMPIEFSECYPYSVATSEIVFASFCNQMAQFDIAADRWEPVSSDPIEQPTPPSGGALPVAAGDVVVVLIAPQDGNESSGELSEMWAYRPS